MNSEVENRRDLDRDASRTYPFGPPKIRGTSPKPKVAVVREIDFAISSDQNELFIKYTHYSKEIDVDGGDKLKKLLAKLNSSTPSLEANPPAPQEPFDSALSLNNDKLRYLIFRLKSERKWQFARQGWPITIGKRGQDYFYDGFRVDKNGVADRGDDPELIRDGCKLAYVMAAGDEVLSAQGAYCHPINLHIDLVGTVGGKPCYLPLILDPDVRYPGGSDSG